MADGYRKNSFIVHTGRVSGDVEQAKQRTDIVKLNVSKDIEPQEHACMEPVSAIGMVQDGKTILYSCTQAPFEIRSMLAKILDKPEEDIRVIVTPLGGGFGKKCDSFLEAPAVVAAHAYGKPVKITLTRKEDLILTTNAMATIRITRLALRRTASSSIWTAGCSRTADRTSAKATAR